jgi:hypothetical protein
VGGLDELALAAECAGAAQELMKAGLVHEPNWHTLVYKILLKCLNSRLIASPARTI